jgi:hypothetical protein
MESRPRFPFRALLAWVALVADLGALALLLLSTASILLKAGVVGLEAFGAYTLVVWYLGRRHEWQQLARLNQTKGRDGAHP